MIQDARHMVDPASLLDSLQSHIVILSTVEIRRIGDQNVQQAFPYCKQMAYIVVVSEQIYVQIRLEKRIAKPSVREKLVFVAI